ncbi:maleylpyruvate isomerase N-terminal domain-containing protein, partial [Streptomyces fuscigenes]|uniref:maleylpyruvate isomerase N-terminal domain-containing protein n=1 Tax=Streptomyces fuscigenes TaxID=1528880 RepID=UPI001F1BE2D9
AYAAADRAGTRAGSAGPGPVLPGPSHGVLMSLLGAWALAACSPEESAYVEAHLSVCEGCAAEARALREAVGLLQTERSLDLDPLLRSAVLRDCLERRPARTPVPDWARPYDAETARLDALLRDIPEPEWHTPVRLRWFEGGKAASRRTTVAGVVGHLMVVDGLVGVALGLEDPLFPAAPLAPDERTERFWGAAAPPTRAVHAPWRAQNHAVIRRVSSAPGGVTGVDVSYGAYVLPLRDALVERAFECWMHGADIADAVAYPYEAPGGPHRHEMVDLAARLLPGVLARRRRRGLAAPAGELVAAGRPGRSLHLEVEGDGGGDWYIPLDSPAALGSEERAVGHVVLEDLEFCRLVAGRVEPGEAAAGQSGDLGAVHEVLQAAAGLSRM